MKAKTALVFADYGSLQKIILTLALVVGFRSSAVMGQSPQVSPLGPIPDIEGGIRTLPSTDIDRIRIRDVRNSVPKSSKSTVTEETCLLPPLNLINNPTIPAEQLQMAAEARNDYHQACAALKTKKNADAEKHLRKAVQHYPKYSVAWVTLGQVLAAQQRNNEARSACLRGSIVDPTYIPAYLCLADIAAHEDAWDEVLTRSGRALELDPANNAISYEYQAAANLKIHNLAAAEKNGLRAVEIDKDNREPRVHFVLAQIYEAKGDSEKEAIQLRKYLEYATSPDDVAMVRQLLSKLEEHHRKGNTIDYRSGGNSTGLVSSSTPRWGPPDIDEAIPAVRTDNTCPLPQILKATSERTQVLIENLQRFSANERIEQIDLDKNGKTRNITSQVANYVAQIQENSSGYPTIREYRSESSAGRRRSVVDTGTAAFALMFHPTHLGHFNFLCEGLTELRGLPAWQVRFEEKSEPDESFQAIQIGGSLYLPRFKGRAWMGTDTFEVLRIETDLVSAVPQIDLRREHFIIEYAPAEFQNHAIRLWLPDHTFLYMEYRGHRYQRVHNFSQFQLFSVDATQAIKEPMVNKDGPSQ
jgi:tetratricopeptide (TPR) repeat protein